MNYGPPTAEMGSINVPQSYNNADLSDITLILDDGRKIYAHKFILCQCNIYFKKLCHPKADFKEAKFPEIKVKGDDPDALEVLLRHMYGIYFKFDRQKHQFAELVNICRVADKYDHIGLYRSALDGARELLIIATQAGIIPGLFMPIRAFKKECDDASGCRFVSDMTETMKKYEEDNKAKLLSFMPYLKTLKPEVMMELLQKELAPRMQASKPRLVGCCKFHDVKFDQERNPNECTVCRLHVEKTYKVDVYTTYKKY